MCEINKKHDLIQNQVKFLVLIDLDEMQVKVKLVDPMEGMRSKWEEMCFEVKRRRV